MTTFECPGCRATYPWDPARAGQAFTCGFCGTAVQIPAPPTPEPVELQVVEPLAVEVPIAAPDPPALASEAAAPAAKDAEKPRAPRRRAAHAPQKRPSMVPWIVGGVVASAAIGFVLSRADEWWGPQAARAKAVARPAGDPMKDPAVWKAWPADERQSMATQFLDGVDPSDSAAVGAATAFFKERDEPAMVAVLARRVGELDPENPWVKETLALEDVAGEVDQCLTQCETADEYDDPGCADLKERRAEHPGPKWWVEPSEAKELRALVAEVRKSDQLLKDPYEAGVARWIKRQRSCEVMRENPALHATTGPYVIFVSLDAPKPRPGDEDPRPAAMSQVTDAEVERAKKILDHDKELLAAFYEGWTTNIAPSFGMTRYGPDGGDYETMLKVNVFVTAEDYRRYNQRNAPRLFPSAFYWPRNDRFITTYRPGADESAEEADRALLHEAARQLVHFYTWDLVRKQTGEKHRFDDCVWRPLWSAQGFADFASTYEADGGEYRWLVPSEKRLREIWIYDEMAKERGWKPWTLKEVLDVTDADELDRLAAARRGRKEDERAALAAMANLFYARAWSFVHFLWHCEEGGRQKYRSKLVQYMRREFTPQFYADLPGSEETAHAVDSGTMKALLGGRDDRLVAMQKEWDAFEAKLIAEAKDPSWDAERTKLRKAYGFDGADKDDAKKDK